MKRLFKRFLPLALPCLALVLVSCGDDDDGEKDPGVPDAPTVTFTAPGLTISNNEINVRVTKDSTVILNYAVAAEGGIDKLVQTVDGTPETVSAASGKSYNRQVLVNIPFEDKSIVVKVDVTDKNEKTGSATLTLNVSKIVPPSKALTEPAEFTIGGDNSLEFFARWDLDLQPPVGYSSWNLRNSGSYTEVVPTIDFRYNKNALSSTSPDAYGGSHPTNTGLLWPDGMGSFFVKTSFTKAQFDAMENDLELAELTINQASVEDITAGTVVAFLTKNGRKGLIYFDTYLESLDEWDVVFKAQVKE